MPTVCSFAAGTTDLCFETAVEADDEWIVGEGKDVTLGVHLFHLIAKYEVVLQQFLHGENLPQLLVPHQVYSATSHVCTSQW